MRAVTQARTHFKDLYDNDPDFRLVWEWRNAAQHCIDPVEITRLSGRRAGDQRKIEWILDGEAAAECEFDWPSAVLAHMLPTLDGDALMGRVVEVCNEVVCKVMVDNEDALEDAASLLLALFAEQQDEKPGARVLARIDRAGDEQRWDWIGVRWDLPGHLIAQLEGARAALGLPRRYPDIDLSSDQDEPQNR